MTADETNCDVTFSQPTKANLPLLATTFTMNPFSSCSSTQAHLKQTDDGHIIVQHDYNDHANDAPLNLFESFAPTASSNASFPYKLYDMLHRVKDCGHDHIISFQPHGRCFVVREPDLIASILPTYFQLSKFPSFQRQLNLYGFRRLTKGPDRGGYYHECFLRGKPFLISKIKRMKLKGTGVRARSNPDEEPNFWSMTWVGADGAQSKAAIPVTAENRSLSHFILPIASKRSVSVVSVDDSLRGFEKVDDGCDSALEPLPLTSGNVIQLLQPFDQNLESAERVSRRRSICFMEDIQVYPNDLNRLYEFYEQRSINMSRSLLDVFDEVDQSFMF
jgi:HSF-type DNA-binding